MTATKAETSSQLPGTKLKANKMPGHWLLARLGKRVLRPGGLAMTKGLLSKLKITASDHVVELAPGLGLTANMILASNPASYTGVERDKNAAGWTLDKLPKQDKVTVLVGSAEDTGLEAASANVVVGEAMLSMNSYDHKLQIMREAFRVLKPGGRYAIHELLIVPDNAPNAVKLELETTLSKAIHVGARPMTISEWRACMEQAGFNVTSSEEASMNLLQPARLFADEGFFRALRFIFNVLRDGEARKRVLLMRRTFHKHRQHLRGCALIGIKLDESRYSLEPPPHSPFYLRFTSARSKAVFMTKSPKLAVCPDMLSDAPVSDISQLVSYKKTQTYDETTLPTGFRNKHSTKAGVWGLIHVLEGRLLYTCCSKGTVTPIDPTSAKLVQPQETHSVRPDGAVLFYVEFLKKAATNPPPKNQRSHSG